MVSICSRIAQGLNLYLILGRGDSAVISKPGPLSAVFGDSKMEMVRMQDRRIHLRALCVLVAIVRSLVGWSHEIGGIEVEDEKGEVVIGKNPILSVSMRQVRSLLI